MSCLPYRQAFRTGDTSCLRGILASSPAVVNYRRRLGDGTTALMAAAFHGDLDTVRYILSIGAKASLVDADDKSAALFAGMRGHRECFAELQRASDEEGVRSTRRQGAGGRDDFVYDLYYFEPFASRLPAAREGESVLANQAGATTALFADSIGEKVGLSVMKLDWLLFSPPLDIYKVVQPCFHRLTWVLRWLNGRTTVVLLGIVSRDDTLPQKCVCCVRIL